MPLVLPADHPSAAALAPTRRDPGAKLRVGIVNVMPRIEVYEPLLLEPLSRVRQVVEPVFVRLESHTYGSSDDGHLTRFYVPFNRAIKEAKLDGLILTGAPVEELSFEEVWYWSELTQVLGHTRAHARSTLGLCWGGLALAALVGIPKVMFSKKLFGVYENSVLDAASPLLRGQGERFLCAHSRHAGADDGALERARDDGRLRLLSHAGDTGYSLFETPDHRFVMHLGHPEYVADRLSYEWERDRVLGRGDVDPPKNFDPTRPETSWRGHREAFFQQWVNLLEQG